jgi:hypothetical protein
MCSDKCARLTADTAVPTPETYLTRGTAVSAVRWQRTFKS